ncbi:hypothetical protein NPIL_49841 [Nephila pilipes]|uniref:Uncharacterized protein n=1 Tax=Nephila pilipes TaxID=299642 RepID=A0A8X6Q791_NEPPI|nr:hypothetical protein NPIL_49841 [Nephila pilipes]
MENIHQKMEEISTSCELSTHLLNSFKVDDSHHCEPSKHRKHTPKDEWEGDRLTFHVFRLKYYDLSFRKCYFFSEKKPPKWSGREDELRICHEMLIVMSLANQKHRTLFVVPVIILSRID